VNTKLASITILLLIPALTEAQQVPPRCHDPLSEGQLTGLVKGSVPALPIQQNVAKCGIDFEPTEDVIGRLRSAGAPESVLASVRSATGPAERKPRVVAGSKEVNPKDGLTYVWIPPGSFIMGCSPDDSECVEDEKPAHQVTITRGFWLGQTPVTQQAYQRVIGQNPSSFKGANLPVETVDWNEAEAYCTAIGGRLPTEAEWEYSARAGSTGARYGNLGEIAWYSENSGSQTHEVGHKQANAFGLYDMLGNVWQWVADWYGHYPSGGQSDPSGSASGEYRAQRGSSWGGGSGGVRVSYRSSVIGPGSRSSDLGFRCVGK
jgi:formylglycine-generating enzyme required for sulfatase activity